MANDRYIPQSAAIPYRENAEKQIEILLIRKRCGGDWGVPKGNVDPGFSHEEAAETEALEEAGVMGEIDGKHVGEFKYSKEGGERLVRVFALRVTKMHSRWLEMSYRERVWFPAEEAAELIGRSGLRQVVADFVARKAPKERNAR